MALAGIFQMAIHRIYQHYFIPRPSKIYPNLDFWFENTPSGNPAPELSVPPRSRGYKNLGVSAIKLSAPLGRVQQS
jgi:hypothetical protein